MDQLSIFDNWIILEEIGQYLLPRHLYCCILVSKEWNQKFIRLLWRNIDLKWNITANSLLLHQQHVNSIASFERLPSRSANLTLPNLRKITKGYLDDILQYYQPDPPSQASVFSLLLSHAHFLESLFLSISSHVPDELVKGLSDVLKSLPRLTTLDLCISPPITLQQMGHIISNSRQCTVFHLNVSFADQDLSAMQVERLRESIRGLTNVKFQDLRIRILDTHLDLNIIAPLLGQSPQVELFYLFRPYTLDTLRQILLIFQDDSRFPLKFLGIEENQKLWPRAFWDIISRLFQVISKSVVSTYAPIVQLTQIKNSLFPGDPALAEIDKSTLENLPRYFSDTLNSLELSLIPAKNFIILLSHLPLLHTLSAKVGLPMPGELEINMEELAEIYWPCQGMRKLDLLLGCHDPISKSNHKVVMWLFKQIGTFTKLEEWALSSTCRLLSDSCNSDHFTESGEGGYLFQLNNLRQLHMLDLRDYVYPDCKFSIKDILWMTDNWTKLSHIIVHREKISEFELQAILDEVKQKNILLDLYST